MTDFLLVGPFKVFETDFVLVFSWGLSPDKNLIFSGARDPRRLPKHAPGSKKYGGYTIYSKGKYSMKSFPELEGLPRALVTSAVQAANNSLTSHTWVCYQSVKKHVKACQVYIGRRFSFPFSEQIVVIFVSYLLSLGTLKAKTIESYLSALRVWHLTQGHFVQNLRPDIVKSLLTGKGHLDDEIDRDDFGRMPILIEHLDLLHAILPLDKTLTANQKQAFWAICVLAFFGSFRITELLSKRARTIDPKTDLMRRDIEVQERKVGGKKMKFLKVLLKSPKESKKNKESICVEVFSTGDKFCPVEAFEAYEKGFGVLHRKNAVFRIDTNGDAFTQWNFNVKLKKFFKPYICYGTLSGHSFRSGLSSLLGEAGFNDDEIMALGRWSSSAFMNYVKLGRLKRCRNAEKITSWLKNLD